MAPFSSENGYIPVTIDSMMQLVMEGINEQFSTSYTPETFEGTSWYRYFYALIQLAQENEVKTSEIFLKLQQYFTITNERILRPSTTPEGLIEAFAADDGWDPEGHPGVGLVASVKKMIEAEAGELRVCVDVPMSEIDDYPEVKLYICTKLKERVAAGIVTMGPESETIVLSNGQSFDWKFNLPDPSTPLLRLTITTSVNNQLLIPSPDDTKQLLLDNIAERYSLGMDFEPQRYFSVADAPYASEVLLEYSLDDGANWETEVYAAEFDDKFICSLENIEVIES